MDWRKGDLALCVQSFTPVPPPFNILFKKGRIYRVAEVFEHPAAAFWGAVALRFEDLPDRGDGWNSNCFRKVTPREADAFDREVIEALKSEPVHVPQHAALHNGCKGEVSGCLSLTQVFP